MLKRISNWRGCFVYLLGVVVSFAMVFFFFSNNVQAEAIQSTLTLNISNTFPFLSLAPGTFGVTTDEVITASTDNYSGYTLKIVSNGTPILADMDENEFTSIPAAISESTFRSDDTYNNKFGYRPSQYFANNAVVLNTDFLPIPTNSGDIIDVTNLYNTTANSYTLSFGVKADTSMPAGTYSYVYDIVMVGNPVVYNITYDANSNVTPSNMPSPNPQVVNIDGGTPVADSYATLSNAVPTLPDMTFGGWCDVATTLNSTTGNYECSGTTYAAGSEYGIDQTSDGSNIRLYAIWLVNPFPIVWSQMGACEFHGNTPSNITGSECEDYQDSMFIDTGVALYSQANILKDFEIHFKIDNYNPSTQVGNDNQQTFVNSKVSSTAASSTIVSGEAPGLIVRRNGNAIEFNSKMNNDQVRPTVTASSILNGGGDVSIFRLNSKIYYSVNNGPLVLLQDITGFDQYFGLTTWFGGYPSDSCTGDSDPCENAKRFIEATLSNMYIKLGDYTDNDVHEISFSSNTTSPEIVASYLIKDGNAITTIPGAPAYNDHLFQGWFTDQSSGTQVTAATVPTASTTYYAHWLSTVALANITNDDITLNPGETETILVSNSAELESYTFSSNNESVATVDENTGEITAVGPGSTTITMTGAISHETKTIAVSVNGRTFTVNFDAQGGSAVNPLSVGEGTSINPLPTSIKAGYNLMGWYTGTNGSGTQLTTSTVFDANTPTDYYAYWVEATFVCKMATVRHSETCDRTSSGCRTSNLYAQNEIIYYGTIPNAVDPVPGFAYTCDVNADGDFDEDDERFYYVATNNNNAVMYYYRNIRNVTENYAPAVADLPDSSVWTNSSLVAQADDKVARFINLSEFTSLCGSGGAGLRDHSCEYLLERSNFANTDEQDGIWITKLNNDNNGGRRIHTASLGLGSVNPNSGGSNNAPRPVIEVPLSKVEMWSPVVRYEITFNPHNGDASSSASVIAGNALNSDYPTPDPLYTDHVFQGWYTSASGGTLITSATVPDGDTTYHAQWKGTVALANIEDTSLNVIEGGTISINVLNSSEIESYTFASNDTSIATVDTSTGVITGVTEGSTFITMTGNSGATRRIDVAVLDPSSVYYVTFDPRNGDDTTTVDVVIGNILDSLIPQNPIYPGHIFERWYDVSNGNTVSSTTEPSGDMTVYAEWKLDVTQAVISNQDLTVSVGGQITVLVGNSSDLESYTFSSDDTSVATVDASTGVITGVGAGTANIIMTGARSSLAKVLEVNVTPAPATMRVVTYQPNGGSAPSQNPVQVEDGTAVGTLPTSTRANYKFFGWYTDDGTFYDEVTPETIVDSDITYYAKWVEDTTSFPIVWSEINACNFNGNNNITGTYCTQNKNMKYIDTNIQLFTQQNYYKDFEIGFTIVEFVPSQQVAGSDINSGYQATLVSSKQENSDDNYPGFVFRRSGGSSTNYQLTQKWKGNNGATVSFNISTTKNVRIMRRKERTNGVDSYKIYYSVNGGNLIQLQDITNIQELFFGTEVWFGSAEAADGTSSMRPLVGTLMDMYVKLGADSTYAIEFNPNGGSLSASDLGRSVTIGERLGQLPNPTPANANYTFIGWFDESVQPAVMIDANTIPNGNKTYVAHYSYDSSDTPVTFNVANNALQGYQSIINNWVQNPVNITTFNKNATINNSTWGDTTELSETQFWSDLRNNFTTNGCMVPSYGDATSTSVNTPAWISGSTDCSKPAVYNTSINAPLDVYLYDLNTSTLGTQVAYANADDGIIHNMIPGQTYKWIKSDDSTVYGYVTATSVNGRRFLDTGKIRNTRDLGGLPVTYTDGNNQTVTGTLAYGRLFRGERLWDASATELTNLGINKEYDVGNPTEYSRDTKLSNYKNDQIIHYNFDYNSGDENNPSSNYMLAWTAVTDIMTDIVDTNDPKNIYIHCRVGADRTGTVVYILEGLLGVPNEARYEEYSLTHLSGLYDRTRYYKQKTTNSTTQKFVYMMDYLLTNQNIYDWYMHNPDADENLINSFRSAMTVQSGGSGSHTAPVNNSVSNVTVPSKIIPSGESKKITKVVINESDNTKTETQVDLSELEKQTFSDLEAIDSKDSLTDPLGEEFETDIVTQELSDNGLVTAVAAAAVAVGAGVTLFLAKQRSEAA